MEAIIEGVGGASVRQMTGSSDDLPKAAFDERIVCPSLVDGNWEVDAINFDGGGKADLSISPTTGRLPRFSPDGRQLAFVSGWDRAWGMWAMNCDGAKRRRRLDEGRRESSCRHHPAEGIEEDRQVWRQVLGQMVEW